MKNLIEQVWSDSMSDNGAIWAKSNAVLDKALATYPALYVEAIAELRANLMLKTFITIFMLGVLVSFHESMGVLALIPLGVCATMVAIGLAIERRQ